MDWLYKEIDKIEVPIIDAERLHEMVLDYHGISNSSDDFNRDIPKEVMDRWCVNLIRHSLTSYEEILDSTKGNVGAYEVREEYKCAILDKIKSVYPEFADECENQKRKTNWKIFMQRYGRNIFF